MLDLRKMQAGITDSRILPCMSSLEQAKGSPFEYCMELLDTFYQEMEAHE